jgi:hypothetical protein
MYSFLQKQSQQNYNFLTKYSFTFLKTNTNRNYVGTTIDNVILFYKYFSLKKWK